MKKIVNNILRKAILSIIEKIEKVELKNKDLSNKLIESYSLNNLEIKTDKGFKHISCLHKTKPFNVWRVELDNGMYIECADDHIVFDSVMNETFVKNLKIGHYIHTEEGLAKVNRIYRYDKKVSMYDLSVNSDDHRYYTNGILSHNTTTIAAFFAWYLCFHTDRNLAILANKQATTTEIVSKVMQVFKGLPFFLKPGIENAGALGMRLDNGCMLTSQATTGTAQIGFTIHVLYIDEFAHIRPNITGEFWRSVYPTLSSSLVSQCIITSTPNGMDNLFYKLWDDSVKGKNDFVHKRVDYWEVPGHDEEWAEKLKRNFGEEYFAQEFELKFDVKQNTLLRANDLFYIQRLGKIFNYEYKDLCKTELDSELYENLLWRKDFDPNDDFNEKDYRFVISIDLAEGQDEDESKDSDYNIANIFQIKLKSLSKLKQLRKDQYNIENIFRLEQIGIYRDNVKDEDILAKVAKAITFEQFGEEIIKMVVEMNFNGKAFLKEYSANDSYFDGLVLNTYHTAPVPGEKVPRKKPGFKVRNDKDYFCKLAKKLIKDRTIIVTNEETSSEFSSFGKVKNKWKGIAKHDDLAMSTINLSRLFEEEEYKDWLYDFFEGLLDSKEKKYAAEILKEPYDENEIDDGLWSSMFEEKEVTNIETIFNEESNNRSRYRPGSTF